MHRKPHTLMSRQKASEGLSSFSSRFQPVCRKTEKRIRRKAAIVILPCQSLDCNPVGPLLLLYAARQSAFWTPAATGTIALAVGLGGYDQKDLIKMSWIPSLIIGVIGVFWIMTIFPAYPG